MEQIRSTFATARVNKLIGRAFSGASILLTAESTLNFLGQLKYLNQVAAWIVAIGLWATTFAFFYSYWFGAARNFYLRIHAIYAAGVIFAWPFLVIELPPNDGSYYPWIWWAMTTAWIAAALSFKLRWTIFYFLSLNLLVQYIFSTPQGGSHGPVALVTDFLFTILTNGTAATIALLLRAAAERTDQANAEAIESAILQARTEAAAKEQQRLDALVHDRVLTALIASANASSAAEVKAAADLANSAITKLAEVERSEPSGPVLTDDLFDSIISAAKRADSKLTATITESSNWLVEQEVVSALTEATLQAVQNSIMHAGPQASRELFLKATATDLKIVIRDNGKGFRPNRIPKGRLGIRVSVVGRVEAVGGQVRIASEPGQGCTIVLEWARA
ncbi:MAG: hypothetical protein EBZ61_00515 [Micrococcales bacterium]|nr:hypothetical protein [Micrococcales bacterium]